MNLICGFSRQRSVDFAKMPEVLSMPIGRHDAGAGINRIRTSAYIPCIVPFLLTIRMEEE